VLFCSFKLHLAQLFVRFRKHNMRTMPCQAMQAQPKQERSMTPHLSTGSATTPALSRRHSHHGPHTESNWRLALQRITDAWQRVQRAYIAWCSRSEARSTAAGHQAEALRRNHF
jgi:hypothetical protein